jgi:hypothetical protein
MFSRSTVASVAVFCLLVGLLACSKVSELVDKTKAKVSSGADQIKEGVSSAADRAKEQLNLAGKAQLQLDAPVETSGCYATFITLGDKRPNVLQLRSYVAPAQESFPSMFLRAPVGTAGKSELVGQTIAAQMFVQTAADSPVYYCAAGSSVQLKIVSIDENAVTAEIVSGNLSNTHKAGEQAVTGTLSAVWQ